MSANFLNTSGYCQGCDFHTYFAEGPDFVPVPVFGFPHVVTAVHEGPSKTWLIANTVTTDAKPTLQGGWGMLLVSHVPFPNVPHPVAEPAKLAVVILVSSAAPQLAVEGVTGERKPLLSEIYGFYGLNLDCSEAPWFLGGSVDINVNSVRTSPTLSDFLQAIFGALRAWLTAAIFGTAIKVGFKDIFDKMWASLSSALFRNIFTWLAAFAYPWADPIAWFFKQIARRLQGLSPSPLLQ